MDIFFWGNEKTLNDDNLSYFVHSNKYPQQTTILGALRYKLLEANDLLSKGNLPIDSKAYQWIGEKSFGIDLTQNTYGYIEKILPVFLRDGVDNWHPVPKDYTTKFKTITAKSKINHQENDWIGFFENYDPKKGIPDFLIKAQNDKIQTKGEDIFVEDVRIGIQKDDTVETKGLFKQTYYRFKSSKMAFATVAFMDEIAGDCLIEFVKKNPFVRMGAEQRSFEMTISECENYQDYYELNYTNTSEFAKIVLLSDAYAEPSIYEHCAGVISETVDFRNIETNQNTQYWNWNTGKDQQKTFPKKLSVKRNLLEKGSVFYLKKGSESAFEDELIKHKHFRKIGYNAYLKFAPNSNKPTLSIS
jgi:CRISPR-associated protein Cmr3